MHAYSGDKKIKCIVSNCTIVYKYSLHRLQWCWKEGGITNSSSPEKKEGELGKVSQGKEHWNWVFLSISSKYKK